MLGVCKLRRVACNWRVQISRNEHGLTKMNDDWKDHPHYSIDPFPKIVPSLLNSADIIRYAEKGCLITDFDKAQMNPASYTMKFLGTRYWWEREAHGLV